MPHYYHYQPLDNNFAKTLQTVSSDARSMNPSFASEEPAEKFKSRSGLAGQDVAVLTMFNDKPDGYFVDLYANHWDIDSNTYVLEFFNKWKGICVEPNPIYLEGLLSNRKCAIVTSPIGSTAGEIMRFKYHTNTDTAFASVDEPRGDVPLSRRSIPAATLDTLLDSFKAPSVIDYLSLDAAGGEMSVFEGFDPKKYTFLIVTLVRPKENVHQWLSQHGYRYVYQMGEYGECFYMHQSKDNFVPLMKQYAQPDKIPEWHHNPKPYLLKPRWEEGLSNSTVHVTTPARR